MGAERIREEIVRIEMRIEAFADDIDDADQLSEFYHITNELFRLMSEQKEAHDQYRLFERQRVHNTLFLAFSECVGSA